jgi:hypothetical protein
MVGAWLGFLVRRRDAFMPPFIAERLVDHLDRDEGRDGTEAQRCEGLIRLHADLAGGRRWLLSHAERVLRSGRPCLVKPSRTAPALDTRVSSDTTAAPAY